MGVTGGETSCNLWVVRLLVASSAVSALGLKTPKHAMPSENVLADSTTVLVASLPSAVVVLAIVSALFILISAMHPQAQTSVWSWLWCSCGLGRTVYQFPGLGLIGERGTVPGRCGPFFVTAP